MIHAFIFLLAFAGFAALLMAMSRHQQEWLRRKLSPRAGRSLRFSGFAALTIAFQLAGLGLGWAYGTVVWCGWLSAAAALVVAINVNRERLLERFRP